ncbi:hypothetical protein ILYODFUR_034554 [Ilyodon furcidens]|uniref:Uncharacterized protein n=1 Tax=Ilyodon furcidens TaxID=33524 RepID=A0ABV0T427_9TELE
MSRTWLLARGSPGTVEPTQARLWTYKAQEPQVNHRRDYRNPPREEQWRVPGEPPSSHNAEAPGSRSDEPTGPCRQPSTPEQIQPWTQRPKTLGHTTPKQRLDRAQGARPQQAATGSEPAHTKAPSPGHQEPQVHQRAETPTTGR